MYLKARNRKLHALAARNVPFTNGRAMAKTLEKMPVHNFPCPKKGKMRMALKQKLTKKPASKLTQGKAWASTPYVRNGDKAPRVDRLKWKRTFQELAGLTEKDAIELLMRDGLLPTWEGASCPFCAQGIVGPAHCRTETRGFHAIVADGGIATNSSHRSTCILCSQQPGDQKDRRLASRRVCCFYFLLACHPVVSTS